MNNTAQQENNNNEFSDFLSRAGWAGCDLVHLSADMGLRRYCHLSKGDKVALLMDMSRAGILETGLKAYMDVALYLKNMGVRVPEIYYAELDTGLAVIEYCGNTSFGKALKQGVPQEKIYRQATDVLIKIKQGVYENTLGINGYKETLIYKRLGQFVDYYMPAALGRRTTQEDHNEFQNILSQIENNLPSCPMGFCHADFHLENLMWKEDENDPYVVIDFQDGFWGFKGYDLLNLLEDARATVPAPLKQQMMQNYCNDMDTEESKNFENWYVLMSCHFHLRVIGLFIKFAFENGGVEFLCHIPRLQGYLKKDLDKPVMAPLKKWLENKGVSFDIPLDDLLKKA